ncbi:MAG: helix-turn-helix transcriptional regulator [Paracoccus sp. (in: a-proteobacteria)]|uniref:helix-turn-helix transcriptional regulator n=1 Tax=Paracoccus sp. TaxID=267 RepID=UPI0039E29E58
MGYYSEEAFSPDLVVRDIYRAALRPDPLTAWSRMIADFLDMEMASITVFAPDGVAVEIGSTETGMRLGREYMEHSQHINPFRSLWQKAPCGQVLQLDDRLIDDGARQSEFYNRYGEYLDRGQAVCMVLGIRAARVLIHASQPRREKRRDARELAALRDDLLLAFEIAGTLTLAGNMANAIIRSLDQKGIGVALLAEDGRLEHTNGSMSDILGAGKVLRIEGDRVSPGAAMKPSELRGIVQRARKNGVGGRLSYGETASDRGSIVAWPAPMAFDWEGTHDGKVVLIATDGVRSRNLLVDNLRKTWGLTQAEARVAGMLMDGNTSRQMADELGVQINSIRAHLKAIFAKTSTHSQVELMKLLQMETGSIH